jgi:DNA recombination protein RmuC
MTDPLLSAFAFLVLGLLIGAVLAWVLARLRLQAHAILKADVDKQYVHREIYEATERQQLNTQQELRLCQDELRLLSGHLASRDQMIKNLDDKLHIQKQELEQLQVRFRTEFENVANRLLEEKSQKFSTQNQEQIHALLQPLREHIRDFEEVAEKRFIEETRDRISLKKEIEQLRELNTQLSSDANNLASALKGDNKAQGDWGEYQLEVLLQKAGLAKDLHYRAQSSFTDEDGRAKRPDFIIMLPEDKHLIIDSKVSLTAYERYYQANDDVARQVAAREHLESLRRHIRDLSSKNYQQLYQINTPDYLLLFVPIEPAFALALQQDQKLFTEALERNIVLVTNSTLLATLRTVSFIWKQERQKNNVLEIARQSGMLYDKFCAFVDDLKSIGNRLDQTQVAYRDAMNKLLESTKFRDTLIGRAERIKELGAKTTKHLPKDLLDQVDEPDELPAADEEKALEV